MAIRSTSNSRSADSGGFGKHVAEHHSPAHLPMSMQAIRWPGVGRAKEMRGAVADCADGERPRGACQHAAW